MDSQIQFTMTVLAGKWIIARALSEHEALKKASEQGILVLMGGTTVSALAELLTGSSLRISGRITPRGTVTAFKKTDKPHTLIIHNGEYYDVEQDEKANELLSMIGTKDVIVTGANAFDMEGNAALMAGSFALGSRRNLLSILHTEGARILVAAGLEKMIPGKITEAISYAGRTSSSWSMGAAVGLAPILGGEIITELEAISLLTGVKPVVIGKGGLQGAEGSITCVARGDENELARIISVLDWASQKQVSGDADSLEECQHGIDMCRRHYACCYKKGKNYKSLKKRMLSLTKSCISNFATKQ